MPSTARSRTREPPAQPESQERISSCYPLPTDGRLCWAVCKGRLGSVPSERACTIARVMHLTVLIVLPLDLSGQSTRHDEFDAGFAQQLGKRLGRRRVGEQA